MDPSILTTLQEIGLNEKEVKVYLAMLDLGESSIIPIAKRAGIKRTTVYNYLEDFIQMGLLSVTVRNGKKYYIANSPNRLRVLMQERTKKIESVLPNLFSLYKEEGNKPSIQMFEGIEGIKTAFDLSLKALNKKVDVIPVVASGYNLVGSDYIANYIQTALDSGIHFRALRLAEDQRHNKFNDARIYIPKTGENRQVRIAPEWFKPVSYIHIYDDKVATFSQTKEQPYAVIITSQSFAQTMRMFYDSVWNQSTHLRKWNKQEIGK